MSDDLRIAEITLVNYRQYYGTVTIPFPEKSNAFSIIIGGNGYGKSNLWNAIHWCLFENEPHLKSGNTSIINNKYIKEQHQNKMITSVQIVMESGNKKYRIRRQIEGLLEEPLKYDKNDILMLSTEDKVPYGFEIINRDNSTLFQISENGGAWKTQSDTRSFERLVNQFIIPESLSHFFILDGEFLQDLFSKMSEIKSGITQISQIDVMEETLNSVMNAHIPKPSRIGREAEKIQAAIDQHEQYLRSEERGVVQKSRTQHIYGTEDRMHATGTPYKEDLETSIRNIKERIKEIDKEMSKSNIENKTMLKQQYNSKRGLKKEIEEKLKTAEKSLRESIVHNGPFILCKSSIERSTDLIRGEMTKGNLPNSSKRMFVKDLLNSEICLCGTSLSNGTDVRKSVEKQLERITGDTQYDLADKIRFHNEKFLENYDSTIQYINEYMDRIQKDGATLQILEDEIKDIEYKMPKDSEDYSMLIDEKNSLERERDEQLQELGRVKNDIKDHTRDHGDEIRRLRTVNARSDEEKKVHIAQRQVPPCAVKAACHEKTM